MCRLKTGNESKRRQISREVKCGAEEEDNLNGYPTGNDLELAVGGCGENLPCTKRVDSQELHTVAESSHRTTTTIFIGIGHFSFSRYLLTTPPLCVCRFYLCIAPWSSFLGLLTVFACTYIFIIYSKWLSNFLLPCYVFM